MPASKIWEERQEEIEALVRKHPLNHVIKEMGRRGFNYENKIGEWKLRKNLKWTEWKTTFAIYDKLVSQKGSKNVRILLSGEELMPRKIYKRRLYSRQADERGSSSRITPGKRGRFRQPDTEYGLPLAVTIELRTADGTWVSAGADELSCEESDEASHDEVYVDEDHVDGLDETSHASQPLSARCPSNDRGMLVEDTFETMHMTPMEINCLTSSGLGQTWSIADAVDGEVFPQSCIGLNPVFDHLQRSGLDTKDIMASGCGHEMCKTQAPNSSCTLPHGLLLGLKRSVALLITRTGEAWYDQYCPYSRASRILLRAAGTN
ncbi:hypothetical protein LIA77_03386 [Sarocladium implicatum]|nr:hypothetical protein LIA77_03386 [Sarocladium implicatum]